MYKEMADLKWQEKVLQKEIAYKKEQIEQQMKEDGIDKKETKYGEFVIVPRRTWKYSDDVKAKVSKLQKKAQSTGDAEQVETRSLTYYPPKEN